MENLSNNINKNSEYDYSIFGNYTSIMPTARRIKDSKIPNYYVLEKNIISKTSHKNRMVDYLSIYNSYHSLPGLANTNVLGQNCSSMVPQGICTCEEYVLTTAYDASNTYNSIIYVSKSNHLIATLVYDKKVHMGGIAYDGKYIWIAEGGGSKNGNGMGAIKKDEFFCAIEASINLNAKSIALKNIIHINAAELKYTSFCTFYDNLLWIGTFSLDNTNHIYGYSVCSDKGLLSLVPKRYIEAPKKAQGICFYKEDNNIFLCVSTSYGRRHNSVLRCYDLKDYNAPSDIFNNTKQILKGPAYRTLTLPSMAEQININDDNIYCIFESGANKYIKTSSRPIGSYCIFSAKSIFK